MKTKLINYIRAGYSGLYIVSPEEKRVEAELKHVASQIDFNLHFWSVVDGLVDSQSGQRKTAFDPIDMLDAVVELPEKSLVLLRDFHLFLDEPNAVLTRKLKDTLNQAKSASKTLIVLGCRLHLPPELERELTVLEFALPKREQLAVVLEGIRQSASLPSIDNPESILDSASGLTTIEAENAFALSVVETGSISSEVVAREKSQTIKKNGILEIVDTQESLDKIGGLDLLKDWLLKRKSAFSKEAIEYGLPPAKGLLITGIAGTGKSLTAKATAKVFGVPLLRLDAGRIFAGLVGQSEQNLRTAIQTAEAIAPCCLWIDELDKAFAGSKSSGSTDGGTSSRVFGSFLNWMQEKQAPVFVVATANDIASLPPELLRKGRWDELFFVDLPNQEERESIWKIQIEKYGRDPKDFDLIQLGKMTEGLTGSEIEQAFVEALYWGFGEGKEPTDLTIAQVLNESVPLSRLMGEEIKALREWARGRTRMATERKSESGLRKLAV